MHPDPLNAPQIRYGWRNKHKITKRKQGIYYLRSRKAEIKLAKFWQSIKHLFV